MKKFDFLRSAYLKLSREMKGSWMGNCVFFLIRNFCQERPLLLLDPGVEKNPAAPLLRSAVQYFVTGYTYIHTHPLGVYSL